MKKHIYYLDAGIVNNVGHNLETVEFLSRSLEDKAEFTVIAGKRFSGTVQGLNVMPMLRYGSPHWPMPSRAMRYLQALRRRVWVPFFDRFVRALKFHELKKDLSGLSFARDGQVIINSMELDDAFMQCEALWAHEPSLRIKVILHYSPFVAQSTALRPKLKKPVEAIRTFAAEDIRITFYADTEKLCQVYAALLARPVTLLPIPHAKRTTNADKKSTAPYRLTYFGTYSEAKMPHLITEVIRLISDKMVFNWSVFITYITKNPVIDAFENELRTLETKLGQSIYEIGPFSTQRIDQLFEESDIFLVPYHSHDYEIQSSGVVMEAVVSGKIPLISRSMADAGMLAAIDPMLVFRPNNEVDMVASLDYVAQNFDAVKEKLRPLQQKMEAFHNPQSFIRTLIG